MYQEITFYLSYVTCIKMNGTSVHFKIVMSLLILVDLKPSLVASVIWFTNKLILWAFFFMNQNHAAQPV